MVARTRLIVKLQYTGCLVVKCCKLKVNAAVVCASEVQQTVLPNTIFFSNFVARFGYSFL